MKYIWMIFVSAMFLTVFTGCSEDEDPAPTTTFIIENNMLATDITEFGLGPVDGNMTDVLNGTPITYLGQFSLSAVTDCNKDLDAIWSEVGDINGTYRQTVNLPCESTGTLIVNDNTVNYSVK